MNQADPKGGRRAEHVECILREWFRMQREGNVARETLFGNQSVKELEVE